MGKLENICKSKAFQDAIMGARSLLVVVLDKDGCVRFMNKEGARILGYSQEEVIGKDWFHNFLPENIRGDVRSVFDSIISGKLETYREYQNAVLTKKGDEKIILFTNSVVREKGKINGIFSIGIEITEQVRLNEELKRLVETNRILIDTSIGLGSTFEIKEVSDIIMKAAQKLTESKYSYVGYIDEETKYFHIPVYSADVSEECKIEGKPAIFKEFKGLWGWSLKNKKPIISNNPARDRRSIGTPEGHIKIERFLAVPVLQGKKIVGQIAVANSRRDYSRRDIQVLNRLANLYLLSLQKYYTYNELRELIKKFNISIGISGQVAYEYEYDTGRFVIIGDAEPISGYKNSELPENVDKWMEYIHPEDVEKATSYFTNTDYYEASLRFRKKNGEYAHLSLKGLTIKDEKTGRLKRYGMIADISERIKYENEILKREEELRFLIENIPLPIVVLDKFRNVIFVNRVFVEKFGYNTSDIKNINEWVKTAVPPDVKKEDVDRHLKMVFEDMTDIEDEIVIRLLTKDKRELYVAISRRNIEKGFILILRDITEERERRNRIESINRLLSVGTELSRRIARIDSMRGIVEEAVNVFSESKIFKRVLSIVFDMDEEERKVLLIDEKGVNEYKGEIPRCLLKSFRGSDELCIYNNVNQICRDCKIDFGNDDLVLSLTLKHQDVFYGVVNLIVSKVTELSEEEKEIITGISKDISLRLYNHILLRELRMILERVRSISRFSSENPSPLMRAKRDGTLLFANPASKEIIGFYNIKLGDRVPSVLQNLIDKAISEGNRVEEIIDIDKKYYLTTVVYFAESEYANLYLVDVTERVEAQKALQRLKDNLELEVKKKTIELQRSERMAVLIKNLLLTAQGLSSQEEIIKECTYYIAQVMDFRAYSYMTGIDKDIEFFTVGLCDVDVSGIDIKERLLRTIAKKFYNIEKPKRLFKEDIDFYPEFTDIFFSHCQEILLVPAVYKGTINKGLMIFFVPQNTVIDEIIMEGFEQIGVQLGSIIEQKRIEAERNRLSALYESILKSAGDGIIGTDEKLNVLFINDSAMGVLKTNPEIAIGVNLHELLHRHQNRELHPIDKCPLNMALQTSSSFLREDVIFFDSEGNEISVNEIVNPIIENNETKGIVVVFRDIREEKRKREEINRLATALRQYPIAIGIIDREGRIVDVNDEFIRYTEKRREDLINSHINDLNEGLMEKVKVCKEDGYVRNQYVINNGEGNVRYENVIVTPIVDPVDGKVENYVLIKEDVTSEVETMNAQRRAREAAEQANRAKSAFLAVMSHEMRSPLTSMKGYIEDVLSTELNETQVDYLRKAYKATQHLEDIINDVLDFSKIESGKMKLENKGFDLDEVLEDVRSITAVRAKEKNLELRFSVEESIPRFLRGDSKRLKQVLINLITNAVKFTIKGGVYVSITTKYADNEKVIILFSVRDTGIGISKEDMVRVFEPFFQADNSLSRKEEGTGLGLSISKWIVENMKGDMWVESELGKGSTFYFTAEFEIITEDKVEREAKFEPPPQMLKGARILLVDDNDNNLEISSNFLRHFGAEIETARNGKEAVDMIMSKDPHYYTMVLMDISMPIIDGKTATKIIRGDDRYKNLPVIAMTAHQFGDEVDEMFALGMNAHIGKPFDKAKAMRTLSKFYYNDKVEQAVPENLPVTKIPEYILKLRYIDLKSGLERLDGNVKLYEEMLRKFPEKYSSVLDDIENLIKEERLEEAEPIVHMIKGVSGNLSLIRLYEKSVYLDNLLKTKAVNIEIKEAFASFKAEFMAVVNELKSLPPSEDSEVSIGIVDERIFEDKLKELMKMLNSGDVSSREIFREIEGNLEKRFGRVSVDKIKNLIENFEHSEALRVLSEILEKDKN